LWRPLVNRALSAWKLLVRKFEGLLVNLQNQKGRRSAQSPADPDIIAWLSENVVTTFPHLSGLHCLDMPRAKLLNDDAVRRLRVAAQHLHRPRRTAVDLVQHLTGVQAQILPAAGLALRARTEGLTAKDIDRARLLDRSIVLTWAMRGTLHLIAAEDYDWLQPLVIEPRIANGYRRLKEEGVPTDQPAKAVRLIARMLEREGPLIRSEIAERLRRQGIRTEGQAIAHLVWLAAAQGVICYGPDRDGEQCFVLVRDWLGKQKPIEPEAALAELGVRYLTAHAPATPADMAFWSGLRLTDVKRAWTAIQDRLVALETERGTRWTLRSHEGPAPRGLVRLLPAFDEYLLGWRERDIVASAEQWARVNRGGGWLHPVVLDDGRLVATWRMERGSKTLTIEIKPFDRLSPAVRRGVATEADDIAAFLNFSVDLVFA
jgi:Winged helix DNA-binding domain